MKHLFGTAISCCFSVDCAFSNRTKLLLFSELPPIFEPPTEVAVVTMASGTPSKENARLVVQF